MLNVINGPKGFFLDKMSTCDLLKLQAMIDDQFLSRINVLSPDYAEKFYQSGIKNYHLLSYEVQHQNLWPKKARILGPNAANKVTRLSFFKTLVDALGIKGVTSEDGSGWPEIYWRIVRPGNSDIGDYHADKWFWDLGHGEIPKGMKRLKIWIAIEVESGKSGLCVIPGSHLKTDWKYHGKVDHTGIAKPHFDEDVSQLNVFNVPTEPGDFIVFHDGLIHRGMENKSDKTRVSLEATLLVPK